MAAWTVCIVWVAAQQRAAVYVSGLYNSHMLRVLFVMHNCLSLMHRWLYSNKLTCLPAEIGRMAQLRKLWLDSNQLTELPEQLGDCTALQVNDPGCCGGTCVPAGRKGHAWYR